MTKLKQTSLTKFRDAVMACDDIAAGYCAGMQALGHNAASISPKDSRLCCGSVDIDKCLLKLDPNGSRWDYAVGYNDEAYFVEVHPAQTSNVDEMLKKLLWLKSWLDNSAVELKKIKAGEYYWIPSGNCKILDTSNARRKLAQSGIKIVKKLDLPVE
jgi:hypothetical protein